MKSDSVSTTSVRRKATSRGKNAGAMFKNALRKIADIQTSQSKDSDGGKEQESPPMSKGGRRSKQKSRVRKDEIQLINQDLENESQTNSPPFYEPVPLNDAGRSKSIGSSPDGRLSPYGDLSPEKRAREAAEEQLQQKIDKLRKRKEDELRIKKRKEALKEQRATIAAAKAKIAKDGSSRDRPLAVQMSQSLRPVKVERLPELYK